MFFAILVQAYPRDRRAGCYCVCKNTQHPNRLEPQIGEKLGAPTKAKNFISVIEFATLPYQEYKDSMFACMYECLYCLMLLFKLQVLC